MHTVLSRSNVTKNVDAVQVRSAVEGRIFAKDKIERERKKERERERERGRGRGRERHSGR
jgi:hypothetical protein